MPCFVYILGSIGSRDCRTYVGWTTNLTRRLIAHNSGEGARSTRGRKWSILYAESLGTRTAAMKREWQLKKDRNFRRNLRLNLQLFR